MPPLEPVFGAHHTFFPFQPIRATNLTAVSHAAKLCFVVVFGGLKRTFYIIRATVNIAGRVVGSAHIRSTKERNVVNNYKFVFNQLAVIFLKCDLIINL